MILIVIIACEVGFWVFILLGLLARYVWGKPKLGLWLLAMTPLIDLTLLAATAIDLMNGANAQFAHSLAALYLGFSLAYGHSMIQWADKQFAYRFANGPKILKKTGWDYTLSCWRGVLKTLLAVAIAAAVIWTLVTLVNNPPATAALEQSYSILLLVLAIDFIWALSYTIWPKKEAAELETADETPGS